MAEDPRVDAGVLLIHGIGEQREGETLQSAVSAFVEWMQKHLPGSQAALEWTCLKPSLRFSDTPASALVSVASGQGRQRLLFAESWWSRQFDPPDAGKVGRWLLTSGSWMALRHVTEAARRTIQQIPGLRNLEAASIFAAYFAGVPAAILLLFPVQLIILLALLLSVLPLPKVEPLARRILKFVSEVLGDSYIYASDPVATEAILSKIRKDLEWLRPQCRNVTILAHSQGAALAFSLLEQDPQLRTPNLITYGAGIKKLIEMSTVAPRHAISVMISSSVWLYSLLLFAALSIARSDVLRALEALRTNQAPVGDQIAGLAWTYIFVYLLVCGTVANVALPSREDWGPLTDRVRSLCRDVHWTDLFASADPVPAGPLIDGLQPDQAGWLAGDYQFHGSEVVNEGVLAFDHTSYWSSGGDFIPKVAFWLNSWANLQWNLGEAQIFSEARKRRWRVRLRTVIRWTLLVLAALMMFRLRDQWYGALESLLRGYAVPSLAAAYPSLKPGALLAGASIYTLGIVLHLGLAILLIHFFTIPFWRVWDSVSAAAPAKWRLFKASAACLAYLGSSAVLMGATLDILRRHTYSLDWSRLALQAGNPGDTNMLIAIEILAAATMVSWLVSRKR
jgi:hypothetical protein